MKKQDKKISKSKKTSKLETRVYEYGVVSISNKDQEEYIQSQLFKANVFRNKLVTIERCRRSRIRKILKIICPALETMEQQYEALDQQIKTIHIEKLSGIEKADRDPVVLKEIEDIKDQKKILADSIKKKREDAIAQTFRSADEKWKHEYRKEVLGILVSQGKLPKAVLGTKPINNMSDEDYEKYLDDAVATKPSDNFPKILLGPNASDRQKAKKTATERLMKNGGRAWRVYKKVNDHAEKRNKLVKKQCSLPPGTSRWVVDAAKQSFSKTIFLPKYKKFDGTGCVGIQLTENKTAEPGVMGMSASRALSCKDSKFKINILSDVKVNKYAKGKRAASVSVKMEGRTTDAVFIDMSAVIHREMPKDGLIKWVYIKRDRVGGRFFTRLQITLESAEFRAITASNGKVAVEFGWSVQSNNDVKIATFWDGEKESHLYVPARMRDGQKEFERLVKITDNCFNNQKKFLAFWIKKNGISSKLRAVLEKCRWSQDISGLPDKELKTVVLRNLAAWRDHKKLRKVAYTLCDAFAKDILETEKRWTKNQIPKPKNMSWGEFRKKKYVKELFVGFDKYRDKPGTIKDLFVGYEEYCTWLKSIGIRDKNYHLAAYLKLWSNKDIHLTNWYRSLENKLKLHRKEIYRTKAKYLASQYKECVIGKWDKSKIIQNPSAEKDNRTHQEENANAIRQFVGASVFSDCLAKKFGSGFKKREVKKHNVHHGCKGKVTRVGKIMQGKCSGCGRLLDRDVNSAKILFDAA